MGAIFDPNFWNGLDKEGLKNQKFVIRSDEDLPSHVVSIPQGVTIANIVFRYSDRPEKTRCIKCGTKRHKNGAVIALSSGDLALIGSKCGPDYFGVDEWRRAESAFLQAKNRSEGLRWVDEFVQNYRIIFDSLISIREIFRSFEMKSKTISDFFGVQSYQRIRDICVKNAGELAYDQKIESIEKIEALRMSKARPDDDGNYYELISVGRLDGVEVFSLGYPSSKIQRFIDEAEHYNKIVRDSNVSTIKLNKGMKWYHDMKINIDEIIDLIAKAIKFCSEKNLKLIEKWDQKQFMPMGIQYRSGVLYVGAGSNQRKIPVSLFDDLQLPAHSPTRNWP